MIDRQEFVRQATGPIESCDELTEEMVWSKHGVAIWEADRFAGSPNFYPVYKYKNLYSYSPLNLILHKGYLRLNTDFVKEASKPDFRYYVSRLTIDLDITQLGGPLKPHFTIKDPVEYTGRIAKALREDTSSIEEKHAGYTNIILTGGRDSLNLLLLPWANPVLSASGPPDFELVKGFVQDNRLNIDVVELNDRDDSILEFEILANCCRVNLEHCRFGYHLRQLSERFNHKVIFWNGQWGDAFMTPHWKIITHGPNYMYKFVNRMSKTLNESQEGKLRYYLLEKSTYSQRYFFKSMFWRGAMSQGAHQTIMRQIANALVLSAYHGKAMRRVIAQVDLAATVQEDVRPILGKHLLGDSVKYPLTNPSLPTSKIRKGISHAEPFLEALSLLGIKVEE